MEDPTGTLDSDEEAGYGVDIDQEHEIPVQGPDLLIISISALCH